MRRDALTVIFDNNSILYGNLVTYGGNGLKKLWDLVFSDSSTLLGKGLVAVGLQSAAIIWINNKPEGLGNITGRYPCCVIVCLEGCASVCLFALGGGRPQLSF